MILQKKELLKYTDEMHVDYANVRAAVTAYTALAATINESTRDMERKEKIIEIQGLIADCPVHALLTFLRLLFLLFPLPHRSFVRLSWPKTANSLS
jgi:hypothetical protein